MKKKNKNKKKTKKNGRYLMLLFCLLMGAACGFSIRAVMDTIFKTSWSEKEYIYLLALTVIAVYIALMTQIFLHEAGHFIFGRLTGYRFLSFHIGTCIWVKVYGHLMYMKTPGLRTSAQCLMSPPPMKDGKMPFVLYHLGGSIMNMVCGIFAFWGYYSYREVSFLAVSFLIMGIMGVGTALLNGVPMRFGTVDNDGYNALLLSQSPSALYALWTQMKGNEMLTKGYQFKDLPSEWFVFPEEEELKNSIMTDMAIFCESYLMDIHRFDKAAEMIDKLETMDTAIDKMQRAFLTCDRLYCALILDQDKEIVERLVTKRLLKFFEWKYQNLSVFRTLHIYNLFCRNDEVKARMTELLFELNADIYPYISDVESEMELIELAGAKFKESRPPGE